MSIKFNKLRKCPVSIRQCSPSVTSHKSSLLSGQLFFSLQSSQGCWQPGSAGGGQKVAPPSHQLHWGGAGQALYDLQDRLSQGRDVPEPGLRTVRRDIVILIIFFSVCLLLSPRIGQGRFHFFFSFSLKNFRDRNRDIFWSCLKFVKWNEFNEAFLPQCPLLWPRI